MSWVTICRRGKNKGRFKCKFTWSMHFALRMTTGNYLYTHPDDEDVKALYDVLPTKFSAALYLDVVHLTAIKKMLPRIGDGFSTHNRAVQRRIKSFDEIPALMLLATAMGDEGDEPV